MTVSTRAAAGVYDDVSGERLASLAAAADHDVVRREVVPDDPAALTDLLAGLCDGGEVDLVVTTGGTGLTPADLTPEATADVCERMVPGIAEAIRAASRTVTPHASLSRGVAGARGAALIVNLPGSPGGAADGWDVIAPIVEHAVSQLRGGDHRRAPAAQ